MNLPPSLSAAHLANAEGLAILAPALVLGASGSLHCFLMCGPLACAAASPGRGGDRANSALWAYHSARIAAYSLVGGLLGVSGGALSRTLALPIRSVLPWMLVAALLASVFDLGKRLRPLPGVANILQAAARAGAAVSPVVRAAVLGGITPLLPCGLLYGLFAAAFSAASLLGGAAILGAFAVGGAPALLLAQLPGRLGVRLRGWPALVLQKGMPLVAAVVIAVRAIQASHGQSCH